MKWPIDVSASKVTKVACISFDDVSKGKKTQARKVTSRVVLTYGMCLWTLYFFILSGDHAGFCASHVN